MLIEQSYLRVCWLSNYICGYADNTVCWVRFLWFTWIFDLTGIQSSWMNLRGWSYDPAYPGSIEDWSVRRFWAFELSIVNSWLLVIFVLPKCEVDRMVLGVVKHIFLLINTEYREHDLTLVVFCLFKMTYFKFLISSSWLQVQDHFMLHRILSISL